MHLVKQSIINLIQEKYSIIEVLDLFKYDVDPELLAEKLYKYSNTEFAPNERLVVLHHDTDFYPGPNTVGNNIYNLLRLCSNYHIPLDKIIFITNHYGIEPEIKTTASQICNDDSITVIYTSQWYDFPELTDLIDTSSPETPTYLYCCLNGQQRQHRLMTLCTLHENNLIEAGLISYHFET